MQARTISWRATGLALLIVGVLLPMLAGLLLIDLRTSAAVRGDGQQVARAISGLVSGPELTGRELAGQGSLAARASGPSALLAGVAVTETGVLTATAVPEPRLAPNTPAMLIPAPPELSVAGESSQVIQPSPGTYGRARAAAGDGCTPSPANLLANPGFESGTSSWVFFTNAAGSFATAGPASQCTAAARIGIDRVGSNMQLYQNSVALKAATRYRLSFAGFSTTGHDLRVFILKSRSPFTNYGLRGPTFNLGVEWQPYTVEFTTSGFSGEVSDARLSFSFVNKAAAGDLYWLDDIVLEEIVLEPTATSTATEESTPTDTPTPTPTPTDTPTPTPGSRHELLVFDWNRPVPKEERGFYGDRPPMENGNWTQPVNFAQGTFYYRVQIKGMPVVKQMKQQFCIWQDQFVRENCGPARAFWGNPGTVVTWSVGVQDMWKKNGVPIDWSRPRHNNGVAIKTITGTPVSDLNGWHWAGQNPNDWYPMDLRFTVVVVAKGAAFSGWQNYIP